MSSTPRPWNTPNAPKANAAFSTRNYVDKAVRSVTPAPMTSKSRSISILLIAEVAAMSLWFVSAAILPEMLAERAISTTRQALLSSGVQAGFVFGARCSRPPSGLADRFDPRRVFAACALAAALINASLIFSTPGSIPTIAARFATGALLAGVYPVGMKIAVGWGQSDRGFLVGALVGALTLGSALPHLIALGGRCGLAGNRGDCFGRFGIGRTVGSGSKPWPASRPRHTL